MAATNTAHEVASLTSLPNEVSDEIVANIEPFDIEALAHSCRSIYTAGLEARELHRCWKAKYTASDLSCERRIVACLRLLDLVNQIFTNPHIAAYPTRCHLRYSYATDSDMEAAMEDLHDWVGSDIDSIMTDPDATASSSHNVSEAKRGQNGYSWQLHTLRLTRDHEDTLASSLIKSVGMSPQKAKTIINKVALGSVGSLFGLLLMMLSRRQYLKLSGFGNSTLFDGIFETFIRPSYQPPATCSKLPFTDCLK